MKIFAYHDFFVSSLTFQPTGDNVKHIRSQEESKPLQGLTDFESEGYNTISVMPFNHTSHIPNLKVLGKLFLFLIIPFQSKLICNGDDNMA